MQDKTKKTLKIFGQHALKHKLSVLFIVGSVILGAIINAIIPLYFKNFFDVLTGEGASNDIAQSLISILIIILGLDLFQWVMFRVGTFTTSDFQTKTMTDLTNYCYAYLMKHSFGFFNDNFVGSLTKKVKWFSRSFEVVTDRAIWDLLPLAVNIVVIIVVLSGRSTALALSLLVWMVLFLSLNWFFAKFKLKYDIQRSEAETESAGFLADTITNSSTIKFFTGYKREVNGFAKVNDKLRRLRRLSWNIGNVFEAVQGLMMTGLEIGIFYLAIKLWQRGLLTVGDFVLIQSYLVDIFMRVWDFGRVIRNIYESLSDAEEMTAILETPHEIKDIALAKDLMVSAGLIEFEKVTFCYHQTRKVLDNFNLVIRPKEHIALIGPSGAGKTTVTKLLMRIYDITGGHILIDGQSVASVTQESLWRNISLVPQDPILFHRSLMENIRYGQPQATDEEAIAAAKLAHCHEFIMRLPEGYNTYVGERGVKLSGGERQRVAIARAILRNAPILILDEATSSLDSEAELLIQDALDKLMTGKTVIAIAHRLSTIRKMDRIVVIDEGKIVEEGSHKTLNEIPEGIYRKLWQLQAGGFIR